MTDVIIMHINCMTLVECCQTVHVCFILKELFGFVFMSRFLFPCTKKRLYIKCLIGKVYY